MFQLIDDSFLAGYKPPRFQFRNKEDIPGALRPMWSALGDQEVRLALRLGYETLRNDVLTDELRAAVLGALASAEWENGVATEANNMAQESLNLAPKQWLAWRVLLSMAIGEKDFTTASWLLDTHVPPAAPAVWDEALTESEQHLLRATCAWMTKDWDVTASKLEEAFPTGVRSMPNFLQEDWFRLAFYRQRPEDAADAAQHLISEHNIEKADVLLQALVRQGWHRQALELYRTIFDQDPTNELLRRRLVGLYIREGEVLEARRIMERGALRMAV